MERAIICLLVIGLLFNRASEHVPTQRTSEPRHIKAYEVCLEGDVVSETVMLAYCVEAEAGNQGLYGKRLVVDVILNRVDRDYYPNTIAEVISEKGQFTPYMNGTMYNNRPTEETYEAIFLELEHRTNDQIIFFNTHGFLYGRPWQKVGAHYFSY